MATYHWDASNKFIYTVNSINQYTSYDDLPCIEDYNGNGSTFIWMTDGLMDRCPSKGPAFIHDGGTYYDGKKCIKKITTKFFKMGKLHNPMPTENSAYSYSENASYTVGNSQKYINGKKAMILEKLDENNAYTVNGRLVNNDKKISIYEIDEDDVTLVIDDKTGETIDEYYILDNIVKLYKDKAGEIVEEYLSYVFYKNDKPMYDTVELECGCVYKHDDPLYVSVSEQGDIAWGTVYCAEHNIFTKFIPHKDMYNMNETKRPTNPKP